MWLWLWLCGPGAFLCTVAQLTSASASFYSFSVDVCSSCWTCECLFSPSSSSSCQVLFLVLGRQSRPPNFPKYLAIIFVIKLSSLKRQTAFNIIILVFWDDGFVGGQRKLLLNKIRFKCLRISKQSRYSVLSSGVAANVSVLERFVFASAKPVNTDG